MLQTVTTVIGDLYGCLLQDEPEVRALDALCGAVGASHAMVMRPGEEAAGHIVTSHHLNSLDLSGLHSISRAPEYVQLFQRSPSGSYLRMTALASRKQLARSDTYQQTLRSLDGGLAVCGFQQHGADLVVSAVCRSLVSDADFDDAAIAMLDQCLPHLIAITTMAARMERERKLSRCLTDALDVVHDGVIILSANGSVAHANAAAEALLARGDRLRRTADGVVASNLCDDRKLQRAIYATRVGVGVGTVSPPTIVIGSHRRGWPLVVTVLPARHAILADRDLQAVMLYVVDPSQAFAMTAQTLSEEFGLTPREASLTSQLAHAASLTEAACELGISAGTARQYLKAIFEKIGVHSQVELLRVVRR